MKAAVYTKTKSGKLLEIKDVEQLVPKDHEVVIRVRAASVNPLDWRMKRRRPGADVAGEVVAVGERVTQFKSGDAVFGIGKGAFAEFACAPETGLVLKPDSVSFEPSGPPYFYLMRMEHLSYSRRASTTTKTAGPSMASAT